MLTENSLFDNITTTSHHGQLPIGGGSIGLDSGGNWRNRGFINQRQNGGFMDSFQNRDFLDQGQGIAGYEVELLDIK
jgi:hypothetical protein